MDKNISDNDRIIIGVREWAVKEAYLIHYDVLQDHPNIAGIVKTATELEEYILKGVNS